MAALKTPLGQTELDALTLSTEVARLAYEEQRRALVEGRRVREERKQTEVEKTMSNSSRDNS